jgi:hypothetical protein
MISLTKCLLFVDSTTKTMHLVDKESDLEEQLVEQAINEQFPLFILQALATCSWTLTLTLRLASV